MIDIENEIFSTVLTTLKEKLAFADYKWKMKIKNNTLFHTITIKENKSKIIEKYHEYYYDAMDIIDKRFKVISLTTDFKDTFDEADERLLVVLQK